MFYQILALIIWSSSFIAAKYAYAAIDPALMVGVRLLIAALLVLPVCRRYIGKIPRREWKPLLAVSFITYVFTLMLQFIGLKYTSAASASTIVGLEPLLMVFIGHFFFNDKARAYHWICGAAAFAGIALLMVGGAEAGGEVGWFGCFLVLLAGIGFCTAVPYRRTGIHICFHCRRIADVPAVFACLGTELYRALELAGRGVAAVFGRGVQLVCLLAVE